MDAISEKCSVCSSSMEDVDSQEEEHGPTSEGDNQEGNGEKKHHHGECHKHQEENDDSSEKIDFENNHNRDQS